MSRKRNTKFTTSQWHQPDETGKVLTIQARYLLLTYQSHLAKVETAEHIHSLFKRTPEMYVNIAHESGSDVNLPYDHTHILIDFRKKIKRVGAKVMEMFDIEVDEAIEFELRIVKEVEWLSIKAEMGFKCEGLFWEEVKQEIQKL